MVPYPRSRRYVQCSQNKGQLQTSKRQSKSVSCWDTSKTAHSRPLKKKRDLKLHSLIFEEGGLRDGTEVAYCYKEEIKGMGHTTGSKIKCHCCSEDKSPSKFEEHLKMSLKKPYSYLQLKNGISLHQVAVYLREIQCAIEKGETSADEEKQLLCDECRSFFHKDTASSPMNTLGKLKCKLCKSQYIEQNPCTSVGGRVAESDFILPTTQCTTCVVRKRKETDIVCAECSGYNFCNCQVGPLTLFGCVQCEKEFHLGCLKNPDSDHLGCLRDPDSDLKAKLEGEWFCSQDCKGIFSTLQRFVEDVGEEFKVCSLEYTRHKQMDKNNDRVKDIRWRLLCAKSPNTDHILLSEAFSIFREIFGKVKDKFSGGDLIQNMVFGKKDEYRRMYCAVVTVDSSVVAAGLFRVVGKDLAELPYAATAIANQRKGYFRLLIFYIEKLLKLLNVRRLVVPATREASKIWKEKFGFQVMSSQQRETYEENCWHIVTFSNADLLQKVIAKDSMKDKEI